MPLQRVMLHQLSSLQAAFLLEGAGAKHWWREFMQNESDERVILFLRSPDIQYSLYPVVTLKE